METGWYESVSLSDYFGVIARRKWIVLLVTVLMTVSAVAYSKNQTPKYQATASLLCLPLATAEAKTGPSPGRCRMRRSRTRPRSQPRGGRRGAAASRRSHRGDGDRRTRRSSSQASADGLTADELVHVVDGGRGRRDERRHRVHRDGVRSGCVAKQLATAWAVAYGAYARLPEQEQTMPSRERRSSRAAPRRLTGEPGQRPGDAGSPSCLTGLEGQLLERRKRRCWHRACGHRRRRGQFQAASSREPDPAADDPKHDHRPRPGPRARRDPGVPPGSARQAHPHRRRGRPAPARAAPRVDPGPAALAA